MITRNNKEISAITALGHTVAYVYHGIRLVWEAIRSCFGSGRWLNEKPWLNNEPWRN